MMTTPTASAAHPKINIDMLCNRSARQENRHQTNSALGVLVPPSVETPEVGRLNHVKRLKRAPFAKFLRGGLAHRPWTGCGLRQNGAQGLAYSAHANATLPKVLF
jgi:hypothetical protein